MPEHTKIVILSIQLRSRSGRQALLNLAYRSASSIYRWRSFLSRGKRGQVGKVDALRRVGPPWRAIRMNDMRVLHQEQQAHEEYPGKLRPLPVVTTPQGEDYRQWALLPLHSPPGHGDENYVFVDHHATRAYQ